MKHKILLLYSWLIRTFFYFFPDIPFIMRLRGWFYSLVMKKAGYDFQVSSSVLIKGLENLSVGNNCYLAPFVILNCSDEIIFSDQVMIGFSSIVVSGNHSKINGSYRYGYRETSPINIKYGVWIGANCTILAGSYIGSGSLVAANSVVNNIKCKSDSIYGGVPCHFIKSSKK